MHFPTSDLLLELTQRGFDINSLLEQKRRQGAVEVHLILDEDSLAKSGTGYLYLIVQNVDEIYDEFKSRNVRIRRKLRTEPWGSKAFNLTDPSGNTVHIEQPHG